VLPQLLIAGADWKPDERGDRLLSVIDSLADFSGTSVLVVFPELERSRTKMSKALMCQNMQKYLEIFFGVSNFVRHSLVQYIHYL